MYASHYGRLTPIIVYITDAAWAVTSGAYYHFVIQRYEKRLLPSRGKSSSTAMSSGLLEYQPHGNNVETVGMQRDRYAPF